MIAGIFLNGTVLSVSVEGDRLLLEAKGTGSVYRVIAPRTLIPGAVPAAGDRIQVAGTASYADGYTTIWADAFFGQEDPAPRKHFPSVFLSRPGK